MAKLNKTIEKSVEEIRGKSATINAELRKEVFGYITAAFGLVAALAWNDAIKSLIESLFPLSKNTLLAKFLYAAVLTAFVVVVVKSLIKKSVKESK